MHYKFSRVFLVGLLLTMIVGCCNAGVFDFTSTKETDEVSKAMDFEINDEVTRISLSDLGIKVDGAEIETDEDKAVYVKNDIVYYKETQDFTYGEGTEVDEHSKEEADAHTVVHITRPGNYVLSGSLSKGQVAVDLGKDAKKDPKAVVTLILDNVDITCDVAPAVIFYNVYECGSDDKEEAIGTVDTSAAGANIIIADGSENNVCGSYVAKIYKSVELSADGTEVVDSKKLHKYDAAVYSKMSINVDGEESGTGVLNIHADNEGLGSELHLTINGGNIHILSGNDGINTNEEEVSVATINGGNLNIVVSGATKEGDGIDSNGWLVINGGTVKASACAFSRDAGIDSDKGVYINGGNVVATGNMLDDIADSRQNYVVFFFDSVQKGGSTITMQSETGSTIGEWTQDNDYTTLVFSSEELKKGTYTLWRNGERLLVQSINDMGGKRSQGTIREKKEFPQGEIPMEGKISMIPRVEERQKMPADGALPQKQKGDFREMPKNGNGDFEMKDEMPAETVSEFVIQDGGNMYLVL